MPDKPGRRVLERGHEMNETALDFQQIHDDFRPKIERYLARMVGEYEAEDLTQEVFVRIEKALGSFRGESQLSTWIYRIATNAALDRLRDPSFKRIVPGVLREDEDEIGLRDNGTPVAAETRLPEEEVFRKERFECYQDCIKTLPVNYRAVVALSELGELAVHEIAAILGMSPGAVKIRLHRGRERLLQELRAHCKPEDWL
jgi:RNA polymerase sigma-70 factor (ECF subfamily)